MLVSLKKKKKKFKICLLCCGCETHQSWHFLNFIIWKRYRLNALFIIKTLNENIHNMHYLKNLIGWLILILKKA